MDTLRIIILEIVTTLPFPAAAWVVFLKLHTPPTKARRIALAAAIPLWILGWRFEVELYFRMRVLPLWASIWFAAGLAAFALLSGRRRLALFSAVFYGSVVICTESILSFLSLYALYVGDLYDNCGYLARAVCGFAGLAWALLYRRLMRDFTRRLPRVYGAVTALAPFITVALLYLFRGTIEITPETAAGLYRWIGLFAVLLFLLNIAVFFLYIKLNSAKSEAAAARAASASPFTLQARFVEKYGITPAQKKVAECALAGMSDKDVATALGISVHTVKSHLKAVYQITGIRGRHALTALVLDEG